VDLIIEYQGQLLSGTWVTIKLALLSLIIAVLFGLLGAWAKLSKNILAQKIGAGYTSIVRGVPDLVLILLVFFGGQELANSIGTLTGLWDYAEISQFAAGVGTIGIVFGGYMTETFRGAILAIPKGQIEAGVACGMSRLVIFRRVIWRIAGRGLQWIRRGPFHARIVYLHVRGADDLPGVDRDFRCRAALAR
jgi:His/Glu/Gln/Arg/opine family amino acid ABC transporter permease subunit